MKDLTRWELRDYLTVPWKRRWYFLGAVVLVLAIAAVYAKLSPDMYRSETRIIVESATFLDDNNLSPSAAQARAEERINSIRQLLESRSILEEIVNEEGTRSADSKIIMEDQVKDVRNRLEISKASGNIFTMAYVAPSKELAQRIMQRLTASLITKNKEAQSGLAENKDKFIQEELDVAQKALDDIDKKIKAFKDKNLGSLPEQAATNMNMLSGLNNQIVAADATLDRLRDQLQTLDARIAEQRKLKELAKKIAPAETAAAPDPGNGRAQSPIAALLATKRAELSAASSRFTAKHPDVIRLKKEVEDLERQLKESEAATGGAFQQPTAAQIASDAPAGDEGSRAVDFTAEAEIERAANERKIVEANIARKEKDRESLVRDINMYKSRLNLAPALEQELMKLVNEREAQQKQVETLSTKKFNAQIAASAVNNSENVIYRRLDEANLPERPIFPTRVDILLIGIGLSLVAGYGAALGREVIEPSLSSEDEVVALFKIPVLASIPEISRIQQR